MGGPLPHIHTHEPYSHNEACSLWSWNAHLMAFMQFILITEFSATTLQLNCDEVWGKIWLDFVSGCISCWFCWSRVHTIMVLWECAHCVDILHYSTWQGYCPHLNCLSSLIRSSVLPLFMVQMQKVATARRKSATPKCSTIDTVLR